MNKYGIVETNDEITLAYVRDVAKKYISEVYGIDVSGKLNCGEAKVIHAYAFTAAGEYVLRKVETGSILLPLSHDMKKIDPATVDLWSAKLNGNSSNVLGVAAEFDCVDCGGGGKCHSCNGTGKTRCSECHGTGKCSKCKGEGKKVCGDCNGNGSCSKCGGRGKVKCRICGGDGETRCRACGGSGEVSESYYENCNLCHGRGENWENNRYVHCFRCGGTGKLEKYHHVRCPHCHGIGRENCTNCHGRGSLTCGTCHGDGKCRTCHSSGKLNCDYCNGSGECKKCHSIGKETCHDCIGSGTCNNCHGQGKMYKPLYLVQEQVVNKLPRSYAFDVFDGEKSYLQTNPSSLPFAKVAESFVFKSEDFVNFAESLTNVKMVCYDRKNNLQRMYALRLIMIVPDATGYIQCITAQYHAHTGDWNETE